MSLLSAFNKPIGLNYPADAYMETCRPMSGEEKKIMEEQISLMVAKTRINWTSTKTYVPSVVASCLSYFVFNSLIVAIVVLLAIFTISEILPSIIKGDSRLMIKDLKEEKVLIKTGPLTVTVDSSDPIFLKRLYLDDVILDGGYSRGDKLKYPDMKEGDRVEVTYSPYSQHIFLVKKV